MIALPEIPGMRSMAPPRFLITIANPSNRRPQGPLPVVSTTINPRIDRTLLRYVKRFARR